MNIPTLKANIETGEGHVQRPDYWAALDPLLKADLLQDWIMDLNSEYEVLVEILFPKEKA